jgi:hypothetical protein
LSPQQLRHRIDQGLLAVVSPGLLRFTAAPVDRRQSLMGALLLAGPGSALSHRTAAVLRGNHALGGDVIDVTMPARTRRYPRGLVVHRSRRLLPSHVEKVDGLSITTAARTIVDLTDIQPLDRVARPLEEWLADRKVTVAAVRRTLDDLGSQGRLSVCVVQQLLDHRVLGPEPGDSTDDPTLGQLIQDRGLPVPIHNYLVYIDGESLELDWAYPDELLAVEVNGFSVHTRSRRAYEQELLKRRLMARTPWLLLEYTADMVRSQPDRVVDEIERIRRARERLTR